MPRTITASSTTEYAKATGARPTWIVEVQWGGGTGTKYYAGEVLSPSGGGFTTEPRLIDVGELQTGARGGRAAQMSSVGFTLEDADLAIKGLAETRPGIQDKPCYLHLWDRGLAWSEKTTLWGGILTNPAQFNERQFSWKFTGKGFEHQTDEDLGRLLSREDFPEVICNRCEGDLIPIVYGDPCYRVPACVVDRPGAALLASSLYPVPDTTLTINVTASAGNFTVGSEIVLIVGWPYRWEAVRGTFLTDSTTFTLSTPLSLNRGALEAEGTISRYATGGTQYVMIPKAAFADYDPSDLSTPASRGGYPLYLQQNDGSWIVRIITSWEFQGDDIVVCPVAGADVNVTGNYFYTGSEASIIPIWPPGTPVQELGTFTYLANFLPSKEVVGCEARGKVQVPGGDTQSIWLEFDPSTYSVNLDNKAYNSTLGRDPTTDPGVTTVTMLFTPAQLGFEHESLFVSMRGITDDNTATGSVLSNPASVIQNLLDNDWLGNIGSGFINSASFTQATSDTGGLKFAFALLDRHRLHALVSDLAHQAGCIYFWDQGQAHLVKLTNTAGTNRLTVDRSTFQFDPGIGFEEIDRNDFTTELVAKFKLAVPADEVRLARKAPDAITDLGYRRDELNLWAYQLPTNVATITEEWLALRLGTQRRVKFTTWLQGIHLQPGDWVVLDVTNGAGTAVFSSVDARVIATRHRPGNVARSIMPTVEIEAEISVWTYTITTSTPTDGSCEQGYGDALAMGKQHSEKRYVLSDGANSPFVWDAATITVPGGGQNVGSSPTPQAPSPGSISIWLPTTPEPGGPFGPFPPLFPPPPVTNPASNSSNVFPGGTAANCDENLLARPGFEGENWDGQAWEVVEGNQGVTVVITSGNPRSGVDHLEISSVASTDPVVCQTVDLYPFLAEIVAGTAEFVAEVYATNALSTLRLVWQTGAGVTIRTDEETLGGSPAGYERVAKDPIRPPTTARRVLFCLVDAGEYDDASLYLRCPSSVVTSASGSTPSQSDPDPSGSGSGASGSDPEQSGSGGSQPGTSGGQSGSASGSASGGSGSETATDEGSDSFGSQGDSGSGGGSAGSGGQSGGSAGSGGLSGGSGSLGSGLSSGSASSGSGSEFTSFTDGTSGDKIANGCQCSPVAAKLYLRIWQCSDNQGNIGPSQLYWAVLCYDSSDQKWRTLQPFVFACKTVRAEFWCNGSNQWRLRVFDSLGYDVTLDPDAGQPANCDPFCVEMTSFGQSNNCYVDFACASICDQPHDDWPGDEGSGGGSELSSLEGGSDLPE